MKQMFKSVYFADHPAPLPRQKHLKIAFGRPDQQLFDSVRHLSGQEIRELLDLDSYEALQGRASSAGCTVNAYSVNLLREQLALDARGTAQSGTRSSESGSPKNRPGISAAQATFRGGDAEPLHRWYPFLEGYSPSFVEQILSDYAPGAASVLDPFAGTGTTPLTAARLGITAYYSELNPLLQLLCDAKISALDNTPRKRATAANVLNELSNDFSEKVMRSEPAPALIHSYSTMFARSRFFDDETFDLVLRSRTLLDKLICEDRFTGSLAEIAILSSLVPGSLLRRAGDLRYSTPDELASEPPDFVGKAQDQLRLVAEDLIRLASQSLRSRPRLVAENATMLDRLPPLNVDAVITSPPYLNGTNYFRNTKLELWFLGHLRTPDDLARFRANALPAGINDVSARRQLTNVHPDVGDVVKELTVKAYDARIPRMVHGYFQELTTVLEGITRHLIPGGIVAIDIGDSVYGGVRVPTHELLIQIARERNLDLEDRVRIRRRKSRGGQVLEQVLLVFRARSGSTRPAVAADPGWQPGWESFKGLLPHQRAPYSKRNWGHPLHSLCSFQGKMKPALASHLVDVFVPPGGTLLDPFAGVATLPFEAALAGRKSIAFDVSPAAVAIGTAKLGRAASSECDDVLEQLSAALSENDVTADDLAEADRFGFNRRISEYFHPQTLREILLARRYFRERPVHGSSSAMVFSSLLHILHGNRPYALSRRSHPITPFAPTGEYTYRPLLARLREKVVKSVTVGHPPTFEPGEMVFQDATTAWPSHVDHLDAIITSPPFFDSTRFYVANWMRLWFAGWSSEDFKTRPLSFVDERQKRDFSVYEPIFRQARERLKRGAPLVLHLGKSPKCDMAEQLAAIATPWFRVADRFTESVEHCESHGIRDKGTVSGHQYLVLI
jgi:DNA modification methylase